MHQSLKWGLGLAVGLALAGLAGCEKQAAGPQLIKAERGRTEIGALVGPEGATLLFDTDGTSLEIPPGALREPVRIRFEREKPSFDLPRKDYLGPAFRISPPLSFAPARAYLSVPAGGGLPGLPVDINLSLYYYDRLEKEGVLGISHRNDWQRYPRGRLISQSKDGKLLVFEILETIKAPSDSPPFGLLQVAYDMP